MRSSSWAQTADEQVTVSTPSRSPVGSAWAAIASPTADGHTRWTSASVVCGASRSASAPIASDSGRGSRRLTPPPVLDDHAAVHMQAHDIGLVSPGDVGEVGRGDHRLPDAQALDQALAARGVELAHHIVEQEQRWRPALLLQCRPLGEQERQQRETLLALRAVCAQLAPIAQQREVVAVGPVRGEAALEVGVDALGQLGGQLLRSGGARARAVAQLGLAVEAELLSSRDEAIAQQRNGSRAIVAQGDAMARELEVPGGERRARTAGAHASQQRVALGQRLPIGTTRCRAGRPQRGDELVDV